MSSVVGNRLPVPRHRSDQLSCIDAELCGVWVRLSVVSSTSWVMSIMLVAMVSGTFRVTSELLGIIRES